MANAAVQARKDQALAEIQRWEGNWPIRREFYLEFKDSGLGVPFGMFEASPYGGFEPTLRRLPNLLKSCSVWGQFFGVEFMRYLLEADPYPAEELVGVEGDTDDQKQLGKFIDDLHTSTPSNVLSRMANSLPQGQRLAFWDAVLQISAAVAPPPPPAPVPIDLSSLPFGNPVVIRQSDLDSGLINSITQSPFVENQDVVRIVASPQQIFDRVAFQDYITSKQTSIPPLPIINPINPGQTLTTLADFTRHRVTILNDVSAASGSGSNRNGLRQRTSTNSSAAAGAGAVPRRRRTMTEFCKNGSCSIMGGSRKRKHKRKQTSKKRKVRHSRKQ